MDSIGVDLSFNFNYILSNSKRSFIGKSYMDSGKIIDIYVPGFGRFFSGFFNDLDFASLIIAKAVPIKF